MKYKCFKCDFLHVKSLEKDEDKLNIEAYCINEKGIKNNFNGCVLFSNTWESEKEEKGFNIDEFKKDYFQLTNIEMIEKYGIKDSTLKKLKKKLNLPKKKEGKNYYFNKKTKMWHVQTNKDYFGYYTTEKEAQKVVEFLKNNNWDKELLLENKNKIIEIGGE